MLLKNLGLVVLLGIGSVGCQCIETKDSYVGKGACVVGKGIKGLSYVPRIPSKAYGFVADRLHDVGDVVEGYDLQKDKVDVAPLPPYDGGVPPPPIED